MNRFSSFVLIFLFCFFPVVTGGKTAAENPENLLAREILKRLSTAEKIGQLFMIGAPLDEKNVLLSDFRPGGVFLDFNNTFAVKERIWWRQDAARLKSALENLQSWQKKRGGIPFWYSMDQEAGFHKLLSGEYFPAFMAAGQAVTDSGDFTDIEALGFRTCEQLLSFGIVWNLSPVADVQSNPENPVIRTRSFHSDPQLVAKMTEAYLRGHQAAGCMDSVKHFPGHGDTRTDSHLELPVLDKSWSELSRLELIPFLSVLKSRNPPRSVMPAHILFPKLEAAPATFSSFWLRKKLRQEWKYEGLVISDNLTMKAVPGFLKSGDHGTMALKAVEAGIDVLLVSSGAAERVASMSRALAAEYEKSKAWRERIDASVVRILTAKIRLGVITDTDSLLPGGGPPALRSLPEKWRLASEKIRKEAASRLSPAVELNHRLSAGGIRTISKGGGGDFSRAEIFTDVPEAGFTGRSVRPLADLKMYSGEAAVVVHGTQTGLEEILKNRPEKNLNLKICSANNPFPASVWISLLKERDTLLFSFSKSPLSVMKLAEVCLRRELPPVATVKLR